MEGKQEHSKSIIVPVEASKEGSEWFCGEFESAFDMLREEEQ